MIDKLPLDDLHHHHQLRPDQASVSYIFASKMPLSILGLPDELIALIGHEVGLLGHKQLRLACKWLLRICDGLGYPARPTTVALSGFQTREAVIASLCAPLNDATNQIIEMLTKEVSRTRQVSKYVTQSDSQPMAHPTDVVCQCAQNSG